MTDEVEKNKYNDNYIPSFLPVSPFMIVGKMVYALYKSKCHK